MRSSSIWPATIIHAFTLFRCLSLSFLDGSFFQDEHHGNSTQLILPKLEEVTGSIRLDHPYHLELPSLRRVGRHFQLDGGAGQGSSGGFDYVLDLSSLEEVGGHALILWDLFGRLHPGDFIKAGGRLASYLEQ